MANAQAAEDAFTQDYLYELQKETLVVMRHYLCTHLQPEKLFPWLQSKKILTTDDCEDIRSLTTTNKRVGKLIDILIRSGPNCLKYLQKAIERSNKTQMFIVRKLEERYNAIQHDPLNQEKFQNLAAFPCDPPPPYSHDKQTYQDRTGYNRGISLPEQSKIPIPASSSERPAYSSGQRVDLDSSNGVGLSTSPLPSTISQVASTGTYFRTVSHFQTSDYPTDPGGMPSSIVVDQNEKLEMYRRENALSLASEDLSSEKLKIVRHSIQRPFSREPAEHDANSSYQPNISPNLNLASASATVRSTACEHSDVSCSNFSRTNGLLPAGAITVASRIAHESPNESFEVSDGDI